MVTEIKQLSKKDFEEMIWKHVKPILKEKHLDEDEMMNLIMQNFANSGVYPIIVLDTLKHKLIIANMAIEQDKIENSVNEFGHQRYEVVVHQDGVNDEITTIIGERLSNYTLESCYNELYNALNVY